MYKVAVPLVIEEIQRNGIEHYIAELKKTDTTRVFIALGIICEESEKRRKNLADLAKYTKILKAEGYEVGMWVWTFLRETPNNYTKRHFFNGKVAGGETCGLDPDFLADEVEFIKQAAATGIDLIQFDDDFNVSIAYLYGFGCCCDHHMKLYREILGEDISKEEFIDKIFKGGRNKYRDAWLEGNRRTLVNFSKKMREAVDSVNPNVRMGHCAVMSVFDVDGIDSFEISKILAGNTRPFIRLIGAPYWAEKRQFHIRTAADVVAMARMQCAWCKYDDVEILTEGDVFPRPRHLIPAAHLEMFDLATRCDNRTNGILKYMVDYTSRATYEPGYVKRHIKNAPLYEATEKYFKGRQDVGVRVYEALNKIRDIELPEDRYIGDAYLDSLFYSPASHLLNYMSIPAIYSGKGTVGIAFGENYKELDEDALGGGVFLDAPAALNLQKKGVDVGIISAGPMEIVHEGCLPPLSEYFVETDELTVNFGDKNNAYAMEISDKAVVTSLHGEQDSKFPACYRYENAKGQRFVVFGFDGYLADKAQFRNYERQRQMIEDIEWLSGKKLDASCKGNPDLYIITKKQDDELSVGLFNLSIDECLDPVVELADGFGSAEFINCSGELKGDKIYLSDLNPYTFSAIILKK